MTRVSAKAKCSQVWFLSALAAVFAASAVLAWAPSTVLADEMDSSYARGGRLYDKWFNVIGADAPKETHPAWPASNTKKKGNVTHRCKSCHGWDLKGKDGAYASGSYKTGIKGVNGFAGADTAKIIAVMKDKTHGYAGKMEDQDFMDLANFVSKGGVDMGMYIDSKTKMAKGGNAAKGAAYFNTICVGCHRKDGTYPKDMEKPLGAQMGNPWEVLHKILNGQPAEKMPALRALDMQVALDLMAHIGTLPKTK
jgi:cytochrome c553